MIDFSSGKYYFMSKYKIIFFWWEVNYFWDRLEVLDKDGKVLFRVGFGIVDYKCIFDWGI